MKLPTSVEKALNDLLLLTDEVYIVGGAVRDYLLGIPYKDFDFCIDRSPEEVQEYLNSLNYHLALTGVKYGTITIVDEQNIEVTTFRKDLEYLDNRFPVIAAAKTLDDDLIRRDFTINAICYHLNRGIIDPFNGQNDLKNKIIKTIGDSDICFQEDALRALRAIRFVSRLGFTIDDNTLKAIKKHASLINNISKERIRDELTKTLDGTYIYESLILLQESRLLSLIAPELDNYHYQSTAKNFQKSLSTNIDFQTADNYARLFLATDFQTLDAFIKKYHFSNNVRHYIKKIYEANDYLLNYSYKNVKKALAVVEKENFNSYINYFSIYLSYYQLDQSLIEKIHSDFKKILANDEVYEVHQLAVNGDDLLVLGYKGSEIKQLKSFLWEKVLEDNTLNTKEKLLNLIQKNKKRN